MACLARGLFAALFALALTSACTPAPGNDAGTPDGGGATDGGGTGTDGGGNGTPDGGNGTPDGGNGGGLALGTACTFASAECGEGKVCTSIFTAQGSNMPDESTAACYAACDAQGNACTAAFDLPGTCQNSAQGLICVAGSPNLGPCGNGANATCTDTPVCLFLEAGSLVGFCGTVCDPANPTTCNALADAMMPNDGCGCSQGQECSTSPLQVGQTGDGLCAPPSTVGDTCGIDTTNATLEVCTGDLACVPGPTGTCQPAGDAGVPGDGG